VFNFKWLSLFYAVLALSLPIKGNERRYTWMVLAQTGMIEEEQYEREATALITPFESMVSSRWKCQVVLQTIRTVAMATLIKRVAF
jgi:hypothetical protein